MAPRTGSEDDVELPDLSGPKGTTVLELLEEMKDSAKENATPFQVRGKYNERMIAGEQYIEVSDTMQIEDTDWPTYAPRATRNLLRNLSLTWSSRLLEDRPFGYAYPKDSGANEVSAEIGNRLIRWNREHHDFDDMCFRGAQNLQAHTAIAFKVVWDPLSGPTPTPGIVVDEATGLPVLGEDGNVQREPPGPPLGDVAWQLLDIYDYGIDPTENCEDASWCFFRKFVDKYEAQALLRASGVSDEDALDVEEDSWTDSWGVKKSGVEIYEIWHRPGFRFPNGLFAVVVADKVVDVRDFPYEHGQLPICVVKCNPRRGSPYGSTHVDDAVYIQKTINKQVSALDRQAEQIAAIKLIAHSTVIAAWSNGNGMIPVNDPAAAQYARYLEPPNRVEVLSSGLADNIEALFTIYGLNEILTGAENVKSGTSAKSIAYLNKLDSMKMAGAARSLTKAILRLLRQTLRLYQQFVEVPRLARISGASEEEAMVFVGSDLEGLDVMIEPASGFSQLRGSIAQEGEQLIQAQGPLPEAVRQAETGLRGSPMEKADRTVVQDQIRMVLQGGQAQPDPEIDPAIAIEEILGVMPSYVGTQAGPALFELFSSYRQQMMQAQQQQMQQGVQE